MIDYILKQVKKTNREMTKDKLIQELLKSNYATNSLVLSYKHSKKLESL